MTKAIIYDLDRCLAAADEVGEQLFAPAFAVIAGFGGVSVLANRLVSSLAPPTYATTEFSESKRWRRTATGSPCGRPQSALTECRYSPCFIGVNPWLNSVSLRLRSNGVEAILDKNS